MPVNNVAVVSNFKITIYGWSIRVTRYKITRAHWSGTRVPNITTTTCIPWREEPQGTGPTDAALMSRFFRLSILSRTKWAASSGYFSYLQLAVWWPSPVRARQLGLHPFETFWFRKSILNQMLFLQYFAYDPIKFFTRILTSVFGNKSLRDQL